MSKRILRWFGDKRNETILKMVRDHLELTTQAVIGLFNMVCSSSESNAKNSEYYQEIAQFEMQADDLRRDMIKELSKRDLFPTEREDLMELVRAVDWVADWAREAGRILTIIPFEKSPIELKIAAQNMCKANKDCVSILKKSIEALIETPHESLELANEVELLEEDIDELYSIARKHLASLEFPEFTVGSLILLNEFLDAVETVADWCENTADIVRAMAIRTQ
jgi:predicted phosphate transport protein (TIGR00153 family)